MAKGLEPPEGRSPEEQTCGGQTQGSEVTWLISEENEGVQDLPCRLR